jgi:uncharacterized protein YndB with AHSA1/START domain
MIRLERSLVVPVVEVWRLWTTARGIESWWSPDGFRVDVERLELRPEGDLVYTMTATGPDQIAFMEQAGMPLATESRKRFVEVVEPTRLSYVSVVDFVPGHVPYEHLTVVDLAGDGDTTTVVMSMEPMHDDVWTERLVAGRTNELDNLERVIAG